MRKRVENVAYVPQFRVVAQHQFNIIKYLKCVSMYSMYKKCPSLNDSLCLNKLNEQNLFCFHVNKLTFKNNTSS